MSHRRSNIPPTQAAGMHRRSNAVGLFPRAASPDILRGPSWPSPFGRGARMPAVLRACAPVCGIDIVGATHGSPAPAVLGCLDVGRRMRRPYGAWNSGHPGPRPSGARCARVHLRSCSDVANLGQEIQPTFLQEQKCTPQAPAGLGPWTGRVKPQSGRWCKL